MTKELKFIGTGNPSDPLNRVAGDILAVRALNGHEATDDEIRDELRAAFTAFGSPPQQVVHQCGSGVTACHNLLAMEVAGLPGSALYPGSWSEWSSDASRPVAVG